MQEKIGKWYLYRQKYLIFSQGSVQDSSIVRIISSFCVRYRYTYLPNRDLWINRLYFGISNSSKKQCLTIDTREINNLGPAKFRTQADNNKEKICYYKRNKRDTSFNSFLAVTKQTLPTSEIIFSIIKILSIKQIEMAKIILK